MAWTQLNEVGTALYCRKSIKDVITFSMATIAAELSRFHTFPYPARILRNRRSRSGDQIIRTLSFSIKKGAIEFL